MFEVKVLADSVSPAGHRLTTLAATYPRIIHAEMLRHRMLSRCAASSRAIPIRKFIDQVMERPYVPSEWGKNQPGMQAGEALEGEDREAAIKVWLAARDAAVAKVRHLSNLLVHKQLANRLLEPWQWMTEVITGTEWDNFFHLRIHKAAHPDIQLIAKMMHFAIKDSTPRELTYDGWHLPMTTQDDMLYTSGDQRLMSVGRLARVSYLKHDDVSTTKDDIARAKKMHSDGHMSPFEHVARPMNQDEVSRYWVVNNCNPKLEGRPMLGNFCGWVQLRKTLPNEHDPLGAV